MGLKSLQIESSPLMQLNLEDLILFIFQLLLLRINKSNCTKMSNHANEANQTEYII